MSTHFRIARAVPRFVPSGGGTTYNSVLTALTPSARWKHDESTGTTAVAAVGTDGTYVPGGAPQNQAVTLGVTSLVADGGTAISTGNGSYVDLPVPTLTTAGTLILWMAAGVGGGNGIPFWRDNTSNNGWFMDISQTNPVVRVNGTNHTVSTVTASTLRDGFRHMYVLTTDGSTVKLYIDGSLVDTWTKAAAFSTINTSIRLGKNGAGTGGYAGTFDDTAIINSAISATDVSNLWAAS